jgi:hypothetical protein
MSPDNSSYFNASGSRIAGHEIAMLVVWKNLWVVQGCLCEACFTNAAWSKNYNPGRILVQKLYDLFQLNLTAMEYFRLSWQHREGI